MPSEIDGNKIRTKLTIGQGPAGPPGASGGGAVQSVAGRTGIVVLTKSDVGLPSVDNTSDAAKPISTLTAAALAGKSDTGHSHVSTDLPSALRGTAGVAYIATTGNNATAALGDRAKPYQTPAAAFAAGASEFHFGPGTFVWTNAPTEGNFRVFGRGRSITIVEWRFPSTPNAPPAEGSGADGNDAAGIILALSLVSDFSAYIKLIARTGNGSNGNNGANGDNGEDPADGQNGGHGGDGGTVEGNCDLLCVSGGWDFVVGSEGAGGIGGDPSPFGGSPGQDGDPGSAGVVNLLGEMWFCLIDSINAAPTMASRYSFAPGFMDFQNALTNLTGSGALVAQYGATMSYAQIGFSQLLQSTVTAWLMSANPTTTNLLANQSALIKNTTSGELRLWCNDSGTMKSVLLT